MLAEDVDPNDSFVEIRVRALQYIIIEMLFISQGIQSFEDKLEQCLQVLRARTCHKDVRIPVRQRSRNCETQRRRLASSTGSC